MKKYREQKSTKKKTEILLVGPWTKPQKEKNPKQIKDLIKEDVKILGIHFGKNSQNKNEEKLNSKIEEVIDKWRDKDLSMGGKVLILRTLVTSKIWHIAKVTGLQRKFIERVNRIMSSFFWYPKTFHSLNLQTLKNAIEVGGLDFPDLDTELEAYLLEKISVAISHPEKQWVGSFIYRLGRTLNNILPRTRYTKVTENQTATSMIVQKAFPKTIGKINDWKKMDYKKIRKAIRQNIHTTGPNGNLETKIWKNLRKSSRLYKRIDLNFLAAHNRLPLANFLFQKHIANSNKCRLCQKEPETQEHLFYNCLVIQNVRQKLFNDLNKINFNGNLDYELLITHSQVKSPLVNEYLFIFKQSIWQLRGALYYTSGIVDPKERTGEYLS